MAQKKKKAKKTKAGEINTDAAVMRLLGVEDYKSEESKIKPKKEK